MSNILRIPGMRDVRRPELTADMIAPKQVRWLWYPRIAAGTITLVGARGGTGKGLMLADLAASVTTGERWPLSGERAPQGHVLWCEAEDLIPETVVPRLIAARADLSKVFVKHPSEFFKLELKSYVRERDVRLIVMSPMNSFLEGLTDGNNGQGVREVLEGLQADIAGTHCAVVGLAHLNKKVDLDAVDRLLGSVEYVNLVRNVMLLRSEEDQTVRVVHAKHNISSKGDDLLFAKVNRQPDDPKGAYWGIEWEEAGENVDQDRLFERKKSEEDYESAGDWLVSFLSDGEWHDLEDIVRAAEPFSHTKSALQRAQQRNKSTIESERRGFGPQQKTFWRIAK